MKPIASTVFDKELSYFSIPKYREFTLHVFDELCPEYFWYIRASQRGHHPPICQIRGGLVHHVKLAFRFAHSFMEMHQHAMSERTCNQILAGVLLHDMMKRGAERDELQTWPTHKEAVQSHGRYCAVEIHKNIFGAEPVPIEFRPIIEAIELHMGRWTWELSIVERIMLQHDDVIRYTHLADYAASRSFHKWLGERFIDDTMKYLN